MEEVGKIETRISELVEELDNEGDILSHLMRMDVSLNDFMKKKELSLYCCFTKQNLKFIPKGFCH